MSTSRVALIRWQPPAGHVVLFDVTLPRRDELPHSALIDLASQDAALRIQATYVIAACTNGVMHDVVALRYTRGRGMVRIPGVTAYWEGRAL